MPKKEIEEISTEKENDFSPLKDITAAPDFYAWKAKIVEALEKKEQKEYAQYLKGMKSLLDFYMQKADILAALGVD